MSSEDFYNSEERLAQLEKATIVQDLRHSYAFIFSQITQLWVLNFAKEKKLSSKSEDALVGAKTLHDQREISDYIFENIEAAGRQYVTLFPLELANLLNVNLMRNINSQGFWISEDTNQNLREPRNMFTIKAKNLQLHVCFQL